MGFNMIKSINSKPTLLIFLSACVVFASGCLKKQDLEDPQVGPAVSQSEMTEKMMTEVGQFGTDEIKKGEYSSITSTMIIEASQVTPLSQQDMLVEKIETATNGDRTLFFIRDYYDRQNEANSFFSNRFQITSASQFYDKNAPVVPTMEYLLWGTQMCTVPSVSCHNLKVINDSFVLKRELADPSICTDLDHCVVRTKVVTFDVLYKKSDGDVQKRNYSFEIAPQLPFLSRVLKHCVRRVERTTPRDVLVENCFNVKDFQAGTN